MRNFSLMMTGLTVLLLSACQQNFKKGDKGIEYKIISSGKGAIVKPKEFMQMNICQYINNGKTDSLLNDTRETSGPIFEPLDSMAVPPEYYKILSQLRSGDSLVLRMLVDSIYKQNMSSMPPFIKKGYHFITTVKVLNIFSNQMQVDSAQKAEMANKQRKDSIENIAILAKDDKQLQEYFKKNNITNLQKSPAGVYVQMLQPGTGNMIDTSVVVKTNYTGRTLDGKMFDSNTDSSKGHVEPFNVNMTNDMSLGNSVIKGWTEGLKMLNKGAKAKFFIPSTLAYGKQKVGDDIPASSILTFDIEVVDVLNREQAKKEMDAKMQARKLKQQAFMDSLKKANDTTKRK